jgi:hypothetical protein
MYNNRDRDLVAVSSENEAGYCLQRRGHNGVILSSVCECENDGQDAKRRGGHKDEFSTSVRSSLTVITANTLQANGDGFRGNLFI